MSLLKVVGKTYGWSTREHGYVEAPYGAINFGLYADPSSMRRAEEWFALIEPSEPEYIYWINVIGPPGPTKIRLEIGIVGSGREYKQIRNKTFLYGGMFRKFNIIEGEKSL